MIINAYKEGIRGNGKPFPEDSLIGVVFETPTDSEDTLRLAEQTGVRPMIETYPLEKADEAYARRVSGNAQFRVVLTM